MGFLGVGGPSQHNLRELKRNPINTMQVFKRAQQLHSFWHFSTTAIELYFTRCQDAHMLRKEKNGRPTLGSAKRTLVSTSPPTFIHSLKNLNHLTPP